MSSRALEAVLDRRPVTPDSFSRLPKNSMPSSGRPPGATRQVTIMPAMGNMIFSSLPTFRPGFMRMRRSAFDVSSFMMGGWMMGTMAM